MPFNAISAGQHDWPAQLPGHPSLDPAAPPRRAVVEMQLIPRLTCRPAWPQSVGVPALAAALAPG